MRKPTTKSVLSYVLLPGIIPQAKALFASGFGTIAFLMAQIYGMVRLLPPNHPYLQPANIGHFGIVHVIAQAANHLEFKKKNWDQITIFIALLIGMVLLAGQVILILVALLFPSAMAQAIADAAAASPHSTDLAFTLLDQVFGVPNFFCDAKNKCTEILSDGPWPFHIALHELFRFYSIGLLMVAVLIFFYFIVVIVGETATSGSPFGQRFQNIWVPIRLVLGFGLLVPISMGLNSAQYITLASAKYGSNLATKAWLTFNKEIGVHQKRNANAVGEEDTLLALPIAPSPAPLLQFMSIVHACAYDDWLNNKNIEKSDEEKTLKTRPPYYGSTNTSDVFNGRNQHFIRPYYVKAFLPANMPENTKAEDKWKELRRPMGEGKPVEEYKIARKFYNDGDIIIRFGRYSSDNLSDKPKFKEKAGIDPVCGELRIPTTSVAHLGKGETLGGAALIQEYYFELVQKLWFDHDPLTDYSHRYVAALFQDENNFQCQIGCKSKEGEKDKLIELPSCKGDTPKCRGDYPPASVREQIIKQEHARLKETVAKAWDLYNKNSQDPAIKKDVLAYGWAGAGIWYNTISKINGTFISAVTAMPQMKSDPKLMDKIRKATRKNNTNPAPHQELVPVGTGNKELKELKTDEKRTGLMLSEIHKAWNSIDGDSRDSSKQITGEAFQDVMNIMFGTHGLFAMKSQHNIHIHPLAQLSALGKGLVDSAITNIAISSTAAVLGGPLAVYSRHAGSAAQVVSSLFGSTAFIGITAGVVLYYILPFLPFVYFFFAVGAWVKGIFEAMVGVPLWALAHLRLDGEGLAGEAAASGYQLILEVGLRPILTVFGLVASMIIFTAQVRILHIIWEMVVNNVGGFVGDPNLGLIGEDIPVFENEKDTGKKTKIGFHIKRNIIDQFFFTVSYAIIVYMMATASFKLVNKIPNNLLRWMGASVSSFGDMADDPAAGLTQKMATSGMTIGQQAVGGFKDLAGETGKMLAGDPKPKPQPTKEA